MGFWYAIFGFGTRFFGKVRDLVRDLSLIINAVRDGRDFFLLLCMRKKIQMNLWGKVETRKNRVNRVPKVFGGSFCLYNLGVFVGFLEYIRYTN